MVFDSYCYLIWIVRPPLYFSFPVYILYLDFIIIILTPTTTLYCHFKNTREVLWLVYIFILWLKKMFGFFEVFHNNKSYFSAIVYLIWLLKGFWLWTSIFHTVLWTLLVVNNLHKYECYFLLNKTYSNKVSCETIYLILSNYFCSTLFHLNLTFSYFILVSGCKLYDCWYHMFQH